MRLRTLGNQFSSSVPFVSSSQPLTHSTVGGSVVTLFGHNSGPFSVLPNASLGSTSVTSRFYTSDSCVALQVPAGAGASVAARITVEGQVAICPSGFSYLKPAVSSFRPMSSPAHDVSIFYLAQFECFDFSK